MAELPKVREQLRQEVIELARAVAVAPVGSEVSALAIESLRGRLAHFSLAELEDFTIAGALQEVDQELEALALFRSALTEAGESLGTYGRTKVRK